MLGIKQAMSTFHPQTDGQTERSNRRVEDMLQHYIDPSQTDWDQHLPAVEFAINNSWQESIKETPFFLNSGQHPLVPINLLDGPTVVPMRFTPGWHSGDAGVCLWAVQGATELRVFTVVAFCAAWNGGGVL